MIFSIFLKFLSFYLQFLSPFLSLTINTGQRSFLILADGLHDKNLEAKKCSLNIFVTAKCGKFSSEFCTFSFLFDLVTNKARISWKKFLALSLSLCVCVVVGVSFLLFLAHVLPRTLSLSLSLTLLLTSAAVIRRDNIVYYPSLTPLQSSES